MPLQPDSTLSKPGELALRDRLETLIHKLIQHGYSTTELERVFAERWLIEFRCTPTGLVISRDSIFQFQALAEQIEQVFLSEIRQQPVAPPQETETSDDPHRQCWRCHEWVVPFIGQRTTNGPTVGYHLPNGQYVFNTATASRLTASCPQCGAPLADKLVQKLNQEADNSDATFNAVGIVIMVVAGIAFIVYQLSRLM